MAAAMKGTRMRELRALGYKSDIFPAKYRGGKCGLSGLVIALDEPVAFFRDRGLCLVTFIRERLDEEARAAAPKCSCGAVASDGDVCLRCAWIIENRFDLLPRDYTREAKLV